MKYKVGVCQFEPKLFDIDYNLTRMKKLLEPVNADLIVLPELVASGYLFKNKEELKKMSESPEDGHTAKLFKKLAKEKNTSYIVGFAEKADEKFFNSAMLVNPNGNIFIYRKIQLFFEEKKWFEPGDTGFKIFKAKGGIRVGLMICFDWIFPECARTLALKGAQIIAHPSNLVLPWCQQAMITRSIENRVFSITANRTGTEINADKELTFTGMSQIINPKGEMIKRLNEVEESVYIAEIDPEEANDKKATVYNDVLADRRTEMYEL
jgi:predicted amidohydrolase